MHLGARWWSVYVFGDPAIFKRARKFGRGNAGTVGEEQCHDFIWIIVQPFPDGRQEHGEVADIQFPARRVAHVQLAEGILMRLPLEETNPGIQLRRHGKILVIGDEGPNEGGIVGSDLGHIGVESIAKFRMAVASCCCKRAADAKQGEQKSGEESGIHDGRDGYRLRRIEANGPNVVPGSLG